jgi:tRNA threonylcarbamoyladenosine biosynthesis protein TsaB
VGLGSLDIIAGNLRDTTRRAVVVADAQRGEWYVARFSASDAAGTAWHRDRLAIEPAEIVLGSLAPDEVVLGPALDRLRTQGRLPSGVPALGATSDFPQAETMIDLARDALARGVAHDPMNLEPIYLRRSAAEEKADGASTAPLTGGAGG